jgi:hypothetical protein
LSLSATPTISAAAIRADLRSLVSAAGAVHFLSPTDEFSVLVNLPFANLSYEDEGILLEMNPDPISLPCHRLTHAPLSLFFPNSSSTFSVSVFISQRFLQPVLLNISELSDHDFFLDFFGTLDSFDDFPNFFTVAYGNCTLFVRSAGGVTRFDMMSPGFWTNEPSLGPVDPVDPIYLYKPFLAVIGTGAFREGDDLVVESPVYCVAPNETVCPQIPHLQSINTLSHMDDLYTAQLEFVFPVAGSFPVGNALPLTKSLAFVGSRESVALEFPTTGRFAFQTRPLSSQTFTDIAELSGGVATFALAVLTNTSVIDPLRAVFLELDLASVARAQATFACERLTLTVDETTHASFAFTHDSLTIVTQQINCTLNISQISRRIIMNVHAQAVDVTVANFSRPGCPVHFDFSGSPWPDVNVSLRLPPGMATDWLLFVTGTRDVSFFGCQRSNIPPVIGSGLLLHERWDMRFVPAYCVCEDTDCLGSCWPDSVPIISFDQTEIEETVAGQPPDLTYTIVGSTPDRRPTFVFALYAESNLTIAPLNGTGFLTVCGFPPNGTFPNENVTYVLQNLDLRVVPHVPTATEISLFFAGAIFKSLSFTLMNGTTLTIRSYSVDTDILTLAGFPPNLTFVSPSRGCNISCADLITEIEFLSSESIYLAAPDAGISFLFDLSLLVQRPANISCTYGDSESRQLLIRRASGATTLRDIPDLRIDVSEVSGSAAYITFPGASWPTKLEDISSKIEIFHAAKDLYTFGGLIDVGAYYAPPTIFHSGTGNYYVNGVLSTFKSSYCLCSSDLDSACVTLCAGYGPIIDFDNESIYETTDRNPSRHITYHVVSSTLELKPAIRLLWFRVKSFTIGGAKGRMEMISMDGSVPETPEAPVKHTFRYVQIHLALSDAPYFFYGLELTEVLFIPVTGVDYTFHQISMSCDLYSLCGFVKTGFPITAASMVIVGEQTLTTIVLESATTLTLSNALLIDPRLLQTTISLTSLTSAIRIQSEYGVSLAQQLHVELPSGVQCSIETLPNVTIDVSQVTGNNVFIEFPTARWVDSLANISTKLAVEYLRHDLYTESSKHGTQYDGTPPFIRAIGSGDYYKNGVKVVPGVAMPPATPTPPPFAPIGGVNVAAVLIGVFSFLAVIAGLGGFLVQRKKKRKSCRTEDNDEREPEDVVLQELTPQKEEE